MEGVEGFSWSGSSASAATELMYEPRFDDGDEMDNAGIVPYGSVYGTYYAGMLEAVMQENNIPEDIHDALNLYFSGI